MFVWDQASLPLIDNTTCQIMLPSVRMTSETMLHGLQKMSCNVGKPTMWILTRSDTNGAVQPLEMAKGLKFRILEVEGLYYLCSENKGTDQLCGDRTTDLRLSGFPRSGKSQGKMKKIQGHGKVREF